MLRRTVCRPQEWRAFLDLVDSAYRESDVDRRMLERSLDLSSQECWTARPGCTRSSTR
jgi:hypothetical protein